MDPQQPEYVSDDIQEILSAQPGWLATWGTAVILIALILMTFVGWQFKYPDRLKGKMVLTTAEQPVNIVAHQAGYLDQILVTDNQEVQQGDILAIYKSFARLEDVLQLEAELRELTQYDLETFQNYKPNHALVLGELKTPYANFVTTLEAFSFTQNAALDDREARNIYRQIQQKEKLVETYRKKEKAVQKQLEAIRREFKSIRDVYSTSYKDKDYEKMMDAMRREAEKSSELESLNLQIAKENAEITDLRKQIFDQQLDSESDNISRFGTLKQRLNDLQGAIEAWKQNHLITAPVSGRISFFNSSPDKKFYDEGEKVMAIVPPQTKEEYVGFIKLPIKGSGKVQKGQPVIIKFDRFPYLEFGHVRGFVESMTLLPQNETYEVRVSLPDGLQTNFGKKLEFRQMMTAEAEIIIGQKRMVARLFEEVANWFA
ncbi:MAG: HlyD family efflux transporter periplasmic adaptor subunit [Bacteroidetes bacterium]|nr:MAG: HlyD family efflux transporter periplasmic adaptor subunit [Bacteroidota bacterium]